MNDKVVSKTSKQTSTSKGSRKSVKDVVIVKQDDGSEKIIEDNYVMGDGVAPLRAKGQSDAESIVEHENSSEEQDGLSAPRAPSDGKSGIPGPGGRK